MSESLPPAEEDTLDLLSDPSALAEIDEARKDIAAGKNLSAATVRLRYLTR